jgi:hypothetical protein
MDRRLRPGGADDARAFRDLGAMGITTNRPAFIRAALEERDR